jgi:hypothetical protein
MSLISETMDQSHGASPRVALGLNLAISDSVSQAWKFTKLNSGNIVVPANGTANLPDGWGQGYLCLISYHAYAGIRSTYIGYSGSIVLMVAKDASSIGSISLDATTKKATNNTSTPVTIQLIYEIA